VKKYSKGISLLVKVNKKFLKTHVSYFSAKIINFLAHMQFAHGLKHMLMGLMSKKMKPDMKHIKEQQLQYFYRVTAPTITLYIVVIGLHQSGVCGVQTSPVSAIILAPLTTASD
jgi:hypothetical protein